MVLGFCDAIWTEAGQHFDKDPAVKKLTGSGMSEKDAVRFMRSATPQAVAAGGAAAGSDVGGQEVVARKKYSGSPA